MGTLIRYLPAFLFVFSFVPTGARGAVYSATPSNYLSLLAALRSGDTLNLASGTYPLLPVTNLNGTPTAWITISGPSSGSPATITGASCCNAVEILNSSYVAIENLTIDSQGVAGIFGVSAKDGTNNLTHDILIQNNVFVGQNGSQQTVAISTKTPTWGWIIRGNTITGAGTGLYLGNSDGTVPFFCSTIEDNLVQNPIGYDMEIKWQLPRPSVAGMPTAPCSTYIRNNVFIKNDQPSPDGDRPNVLVGGFPDSGPGSTDLYEIYGNFFYHDPRESLFQGSGRVSLHDNIFVDSYYAAITLRAQDLPLKLGYVYNNTVYTNGQGIYFGTAATVDDGVTGNLVFAGTPIGGYITNQSNNTVDAFANATQYVNAPSFALGSMNFYPRVGMAQGTAIDLTKFNAETDYLLDFNAVSKAAGSQSVVFRGAYAGEGTNPGWTLQAGIKPVGTSPAPTPPPALTALTCSPTSLSAAQTSTCSLTLSASTSAATIIAVSSNSAAVSVPSSVTVPGGTTTASFTATAGTVTATQQATVTASLNGASSAATLTVNATSPSSGAAPVRIQSKGATGAYVKSVALTLPLPATSGDQLIVAVSDYYAADGTPFAISDSKGNTWKSAVDFANGAHLLVFYAENIVGGASETITVTASSATYFSVSAVEYAGLASSNSLDVTVSNRVTSASYSSPAATIASGNELLFGVHHVWGSGVVFTPATGWSTVGVQVSYDETQVQDQIAAAAGTYASAGTESSSNDTQSVLVAFKPAGAVNSGSGSPAPVISAVQSSAITSSAATISWTTDVSADSQVEFGTTTAYGSSSPLNSTLGTAHAVSLSGLSANTLYHYRVKSKNSSGVLTASSDYTFSTLPGSTSTPVRVQSKGAAVSYVKSLAVTLPNATTSGNQLIVAVADYYATDGAPFSIADSAGNTWKTAVDYVNGAHVMVFYAENIVGSSSGTITVTASSASYFSVTAVEYSGLATSSSLDVVVSNRATTANYTSPVATVASANELLFGVHHVWGSGVLFTPATAWSTVGLQVSYDETQVQDRITAAAATYASSGTESSSNDTESVLAVFRGR